MCKKLFFVTYENVIYDEMVWNCIKYKFVYITQP